MGAPLRLSVDVETAGGRHHRWAGDESDPSKVPSGLTFSSTMPGGFETCELTLPRKSGSSDDDIERLSTLRVLGPGSDLVWEGRLETAPRTSGDELSVSPGAVGFQAELEDDKSVRFIGFDRDLNNWGPIPSSRRQSINDALVGGSKAYKAAEGQVVPDANGELTQAQIDDPTLLDSEPALLLEAEAPWTLGGRPGVEAWYDAKGLSLGPVYYAWKQNGKIGFAPPDPDWSYTVSLADAPVGATDSTANLRAQGPGQGILIPTAGTRKWAFVQLRHDDNIDGAFAGWVFDVWFTALAVTGDHGIQWRGQGPLPHGILGLYASDIVRYLVPKYTTLNVTSESVQQSGFVLEQFAYLDPTTCGELVRQATRVGLQDWAVWDDKTFWWAQRGTHGRKWRARASTSQLSETGPSVERVWNSIIVGYQDVDGSTRTVGPPSSGADVETDLLRDPDPENPANKAGIVKRDLLQMSGVALPATAIEVGRMFLQESKQLDSSGQASLVGYVRSDRGVTHPAWRVRAGDEISFVDASDASARRVVRATWDHDSRTCSVDLDAPPESMSALLERLNATLVPLGMGG